MSKKNNAAILAEVNKKLSERSEKETGKPIYRLRVIFPDTSFSEDAIKKEAEKAK